MHLAIDEDRFEVLLEAGEFNAVARDLMALPTEIDLNLEHEDSLVRASISCPILGRMIEGSGKSEAMAFLSVLNSRFLALRIEDGDDLLGDSFQEDQEVRESTVVVTPSISLGDWRNW